MRRMVGLVAVLAVLGGEARGQAAPAAGEPAKVSVGDFGVVPRPAARFVLLALPGVQEELRMTAAQKGAVTAAIERRAERIRQARGEIADRAAFLAARDRLSREAAGEMVGALEPGQRARLDQVQLQVQGPLAFRRAEFAAIAEEGPDPLDRLGLLADQKARLAAIAQAGAAEIDAAASFELPVPPEGKVPDAPAIARLVASPEFLAAKLKAAEAALASWKGVMARIDADLTAPQRVAYLALLGAPGDFTRLRPPEAEAARDAQLVANLLRLADPRANAAGNGNNGGQRSDPDFDARVPRPAYVATHPKILLDEAHNNFHTAAGRYAPFAAVATNDGYVVIPNREKFTAESLARGEILLIANALQPGGAEAEDESKAIIAATEADAVRDWVREGGSLLLITDHAPFGHAAQRLAKRFGVAMSLGFTSDPENSEGDPTHLVFGRSNGLLGDHPITRGRDPSEALGRVKTFTGQSLQGPPGSVALLKLAPSAVDEVREGQTVPAKGRAQGLAFPFGAGRVVVLGEAGQLSAQVAGPIKFGMNVPGIDNRQFALNTLHWLSGLLEPREPAR